MDYNQICLHWVATCHVLLHAMYFYLRALLSDDQSLQCALASLKILLKI